ncbi:MutH/Sau3AI family endonuclease [Exiguobacterium sp. s193]|uniref:MutH/Sau3AI family endonuclease n=1 Tax=Exiguobacterium sp. s193 TaxID=2751207 RepID=UPI001BEA2A7E|nr:MutH/Sau3AI family endonuclease [Exiguobacterium sp. s193]
MQRPEFTKTQLVNLLEDAKGRTLGEVDVKNVFKMTETSTKVTGIAGSVIEQSLLGYKANSNPEPDIIVDGIDFEVKTTGLRKPRKKSSTAKLEAKEPLTITAVREKEIEDELFHDSHFWKKAQNLLLVYYEYASPKTVIASKYRDFPLVGYHFHTFSKEERSTLQHDWELIRDYIKKLRQEQSGGAPDYSTLSSALRKQLTFLGTSPKWPKNPRFRIKRAFVSNMYNKSVGKTYASMPEDISTMEELEVELKRLSKEHVGRTARELCETFNIKHGKKAPKSMAESIIVRMLGAKGKASNVDFLSKLNLLMKSIRLTEEGLNVEDTKLFPLDLTETLDEAAYEESLIYYELRDTQLLFMMFKTVKGQNRLDDVFQGFKHFVIPEELIEEDAQNTWTEIRSIMSENRLATVPVLNKDGTQRLTPKTKIPMEATNLPKSKEYTFFLRGTSSDASNKSVQINGIRIYRQNIWMKGKIVASLLNETPFIGQ